MRIGELVTRDTVFRLREPGKAQTLAELARRAAAALDRDREALLQALVRRESLGSTGLGHGVALPHARLGGLDHPAGFFALLRPAVPFDAIDEQPVDLVFLLLLPEQVPQANLKALACVARRLRDPALASRLRDPRNTSALYALLTEQ